jgi:hypothetical protein
MNNMTLMAGHNFFRTTINYTSGAECLNLNLKLENFVNPNLVLKINKAQITLVDRMNENSDTE